MKMDVNSNGYTFGFAAVLVIVVVALLSFTATSLQERQEENVAQEKKQNILESIGKKVERTLAAAAYEQIIKEEVVVINGTAAKGAGVAAFGVDMADEIKKPVNERHPLSLLVEFEGNRSYIIPLRGMGFGVQSGATSL